MSASDLLRADDVPAADLETGDGACGNDTSAVLVVGALRALRTSQPGTETNGGALERLT